MESSCYFPFWLLDRIKHPSVLSMAGKHQKSLEKQIAEMENMSRALSLDCPSGFSGVCIDDESGDQSVKIKIPQPKGEEMRFSDTVEKISKSSGYSIVIEDFKSKRSYKYYEDEDSIFGQEIPLFTMLKDAGGYDYGWYVNDTDKVIIGSEDTWYERHRNLMPEKLITDLGMKLNSTGIDLDDVVPLVAYTEEQLSEWIADNPSLGGFSPFMMEDDKEFWRLYDALSPSDKTAAKSESGISISKINPHLTAEIFAKAAYQKQRSDREYGETYSFGRAMMSDPGAMEKITQWLIQQHPEFNPDNSDEDSVPDIDISQIISEVKQQFPELFAPIVMPTDPLIISKLRLRVIRSDFPNMCMEDPSVKMPEITKKHGYTLEVTGDDVKITANSPCSLFPIYSEKRQAELYKEQGIIDEEYEEDDQPAE